MTYRLEDVADLVNDEERQLARLVGAVAYSRRVRQLLEKYLVLAHQRGAKSEVRAVPASTPPKAKATPIKSPRAAIEVNVTKPIDLDEQRRARARSKRERGEP